MYINDFLNEYEKKDSSIRETYFTQTIDIRKYVPIMRKREIALKIASCNFTENGDVKLNSFGSYLLYSLYLVSEWTNLEIDFDSSITDITVIYDRLSACGLLEKITEYIPESEKIEFDAIYKMMLNDLISNKNEIHNFIREQVDRFSGMTSLVTSSAINGLKNYLSENLSDFDSEDIKVFLKEMVKYNNGND